MISRDPFFYVESTPAQRLAVHFFGSQQFGRGVFAPGMLRQGNPEGFRKIL